MTPQSPNEMFKNAFANMLDLIGFNANEIMTNMSQKVLVLVPTEKRDNIADELLLCMGKVCSTAPYDWDIKDTVPNIQDSTTFEDLFNGWFINNII